jgi:hypothetical protein
MERRTVPAHYYIQKASAPKIVDNAMIKWETALAA